MSGETGKLSQDRGFIEALRRDMLRFASLQLRDPALAEDVVQETMLAALGGTTGGTAGGKADFAGRSQLKTWVFAILRNKIVDTIRQRSRTINVSALSSEDEALDQCFESLFDESGHWHAQSRPEGWGNPEQSLQQQEFWAIFEACLDHLPENTARVFMMREFLEFETPEVCAELKISAGNCHVILHRARNALRRCLEGSWFAPGGQTC